MTYTKKKSEPTVNICISLIEPAVKHKSLIEVNSRDVRFGHKVGQIDLK